MCGIAATFTMGGRPDAAGVRRIAQRRLSHRGPDGVGAEQLGRAAVAHTRLAIVDVAGGAQPMRGEHDRTLLSCNGEIYNHRDLRRRLERSHRFTSSSDSEVVLHLYEELGDDCVRHLDGMFAFFVTDGARFAAARDPLGIKPLYYGRDHAGRLMLASEFKALTDDCPDYRELPAGSLLTQDGAVRRWFTPRWASAQGTEVAASPGELLQRLERSVIKRLMSDVPMGVFLSGGLDSSLIAALARPHLGRMKTFAVGLPGSADVRAARLAASALDAEHHERTYSLEDVDRELVSVIYHLESYDAALVRSAVPCYFLSDLAAEHVKVVLTGEGADELFAGYAYFAGITDPAALHRECARLLLGLHSMNLQRVDRMTMAHGLEGRVPFLDVDFVAWAMSLSPELKFHREPGSEKRLLRDAAALVLPDAIARRPKLEFSQGSSADELLSSYAASRVSDRDLARAQQRFVIDTPRTKEELLYRLIFDQLFPGEAARRTVQRWRPGTTPERELDDGTR